MVRTFSQYSILLLVALQTCQAFVTPTLPRTPSLYSPPQAKVNTNVNTKSQLHLSPVDVVDTTASLGNSMMLLAETEPWVQPLANVLDPTLNILSLAMLCRVVISWYPTTDVNAIPFSLVVWPTEPLLKLTRGVVPPAFGVDISPIVWLGIFTFLHEIFLGQQGLLMMKIRYGI